MVGYRPLTAPLCLSSDFYQHHRPERDPLIMGGISVQQPLCVVLRGFQPSWFLGSLWSLWPPRNSFQEHNNQISCCRLEPGRTKGGGGRSRRPVSVHRSWRTPRGHVRRNRLPAPFDKAPSLTTHCPYLRPGGYAPKVFTLPREILAVENTHPGPATRREPPLVHLSSSVFLHGNP